MSRRARDTMLWPEANALRMQLGLLRLFHEGSDPTVPCEAVPPDSFWAASDSLQQCSSDQL
eukprot:3375991-Alexandrium_andersonii.AAC.1